MKKTFFSKLPNDLKLVCIEHFKQRGGQWRSEIRRQWDIGRDVGALRRLRNQVGPSDLDKIRTCDVRDWLPVAEQLATLKAERADLTEVRCADGSTEMVDNEELEAAAGIFARWGLK